MNYSTTIVAGSVAFDEIMNFPAHFVDYIQKDKLHQINVSFVVDRLEKQLGGTATNIAYNLSLLTDSNIQVISAIGKDGDDFISFFKKNNIDTNLIIINKTVFTSTGKVITDMSDNQIWGYYYGPLGDAKRNSIIQKSQKKTLVILSATAGDAFLNHQKECIENKIDYLYDPGMTLTWIKKDELADGIKNCKWLVANDYELSSILKITGLSKSEILKKIDAIITTQGEKGVEYQTHKATIRVPGFRIVKIVDPTGAGDAWRGGFIAGILEGIPELDSLVQANALASFAVEAYGTVNHHPSKKQIGERMRKIINSM